MRLIIKLKEFISYIIMMAIASVFALFLSGRVGWIIVIAFLIAPFLSYILFVLSYKMIRCEVDIVDAKIEKKDKYTINVIIKNKNFLPSMPILVDIKDSDNLRTNNRGYEIAMLPFSSKVLKVVFTPYFCGGSTVGVTSIRMTDLMGIFEINIMSEPQLANVGIISEIQEISENDEVVRNILMNYMRFEKGGGTTENAERIYGGFPGYEYREYIYGDPMKMINWKQSAKRDKLYVRLNDEIATNSVNIVLENEIDENMINYEKMRKKPEYCNYSKKEIVPAIVENTINRTIGIISVMLKHNYKITFYYNQEEIIELEELEDIETLIIKLADYRVKSGENNKENLKYVDSEMKIILSPYDEIM